MNKKPVIDPEHVYASDHRVVDHHRLLSFNKNRSEEEKVTIDYLPDEFDEFKDNTQFQVLKSSSTCRISDI